MTPKEQSEYDAVCAAITDYEDRQEEKTGWRPA